MPACGPDNGCLASSFAPARAGACAFPRVPKSKAAAILKKLRLLFIFMNLLYVVYLEYGGQAEAVNIPMACRYELETDR